MCLYIYASIHLCVYTFMHRTDVVPDVELVH